MRLSARENTRDEIELEREANRRMFSSTSMEKTERTADVPLEKPALVSSDDRVTVTKQESKQICQVIDLYILPLLAWIYFIQISDKSIIGYSAVFGLKRDAGLVGNQYSMVSAMGYYAQLVMQPLAAYLLVRWPVRRLMLVTVFCWGVSLCGMAASNSYRSLLATRFLLGAFEAAVLPMFGLLMTAFYRRGEQPLRIAVWFGQNGVSTMVNSAICFGLGHIRSGFLHSYQIIFLIYGLTTVVTAPLIYWRMDNSPAEARFLTPHQRLQAVERLRANQNTSFDKTFKAYQVIELLLEPKTWLFTAISFCTGQGVSVLNIFGPLVLNHLIGFTPYQSMLLNISFGAFQLLIIALASYLAYRFKNRGFIFAGMMAPVVLGLALLYGLPHTRPYRGGLLFGYYCLAFTYGAAPLVVAWMNSTYAGATKKAGIFAIHNAAAAVGSIAGPHIFNSADAPDYYPGLKGTLVIFCCLIGLISLQVLTLAYLNRSKEKQRIAHGKPAKFEDTSMMTSYQPILNGGDEAFADLTDKENDEFVYGL